MNAVESTVSEWPGIETGPHDRGGNEFTLNEREIGHMHDSQLVDIPFTKQIRDVLIEEQRAEKHHVVPNSGWASYHVRSEADVAGAIWLLRLSYLHHLTVLRNQGRADRAIDIETELAELGVSESIHEAFPKNETSE